MNKGDAVAQQRVLEESIRREMKTKRDDAAFTLNPSTIRLVSRKIGETPVVTEADRQNFREMKRCLERARQKPQLKSRDGLPATAGQDYGWWWAEGTSRKLDAQSGSTSMVKDSTSLSSSRSGAKSALSHMNSDKIDEIVREQQEAEYDAATAKISYRTANIAKVPLNEPPRSKTSCEETKHASRYWNLLGKTPFSSSSHSR